MTASADYLGNPLSTADPDSVAAIDDFVGGFIGYEGRIERVLAAARPGEALANAYAGILHMLAETSEAPQAAKAFLLAAEAAPIANDRERGVIAHLRAWIEGELPRALAISREVVDANPRDLAMVKLHQYHAFNLGDFAEMLRIVERVIEANRDVPQAHAMRAFALEQCHLLEDAEAAAREALDLYPQEPWGHHALAHVMLTQGRIEEGADFLQAAAPSWAELNSFIYTHNWWHLALFRLSQGHGAAALAIYDDHVWAKVKSYSQDQIGAVSLLARLEFAGVDVGGRWSDVADHLAVRASDTVQPFLSLQYLYGLRRAGRPEAETLLRAIRQAAADAPEHLRPAWTEAALPAAEGISAFLGGDPGQGAARLGTALPRMSEVGGSHAQRDLFEQIHLQALFDAGRWALAQQLLEQRRAHDPDGVPLNRTLARLYEALDLPKQAAQAAHRAERALSRKTTS